MAMDPEYGHPDATISVNRELQVGERFRAYGPPAIASRVGVRRLTPLETERLQGMPDDWTLVPHRGKPMADSPRYRMVGNSMAVPVMRWLGGRIDLVQAMLRSTPSRN